MSEGGGNNAAESLEDELFVLCKSELLSEEGLRAIIDTPNHHYNLRRRNRHVDDVEDYSFFLDACDNERVTEGIIRCLLEYFPDAASATGERGWSPLHCACSSKGVTLGVIQLLIDAAPESVRSIDDHGWIPLHFLCFNSKVDEAADVQILKLLIENYPEAARHVDNAGQLPIHLAREKSLEFYQVLIEAYPGSERMSDARGALPLHLACGRGSLSTVKYLYQQYPDGIATATTRGSYPVHAAISSTKHRNDPAAAATIVQFLLDCDPNQKLVQYQGNSLIHFACGQQYNDSNIEAVIQMIKVIFDAHPATIRSNDSHGRMPLHVLCCNREMDEASAVQILKLLIEKYPEAVRDADNYDCLPIHLAAMTKSPEVCQVLIEAYPGSERMSDARGALPLHLACANNSLATVKYLYGRYPAAINHATTSGQYPIFYLMCSIVRSDNPRDNPSTAGEIVQFLLDCNPNVKTQTIQGRSLLRLACTQQYNDSNIEAGIQIIKMLFDTYPEAIEDSKIVRDIHRYHQQVQAFINSQLVHARQAKDYRLMTTLDDNGRLPLHTALQNNVRLGSIKLLMKGNPAAILSLDNSGALPLHVACQHHNSTDVFDYLVGVDPSTLDAVDRDGNTALHLACGCAKYETITLLLEKYDAVSVSKRNNNKKVPIDLLWESIAVEDRESVEYTGSVFQLLKAYPETVTNNNVDDITEQTELSVSSSHNAKKRKRSAVDE